jgi:hypothetical protein
MIPASLSPRPLGRDGATTTRSTHPPARADITLVAKRALDGSRYDYVNYNGLMYVDALYDELQHLGHARE